ncbi:unnamed protein product [Rotaria socialis]|uniref:RNA-directed RNA polymerase n=1 Tax=Rotaria socialis TaxID=392032 RepID=A0A818J579_9BILA|nr:unnamed protein product [Rotaria socialis]CAF4539600.1 unnamed protein product [Rotaria socialis]
MDELINDTDETSDNRILASDCFDDEFNREPDEEDVNIDHEIDQIVDEELNKEIEQGSQIADEPEVHIIYDDEDNDGSDSGYDETNISVITPEPVISLPTIVITTSTPGRGRGRVNSKAVDTNNEPLPKPRITDVEPDKDAYPKPPRIARLPHSYFRKREDPALVIERRAPIPSSPLIDFRVTLDQISFIIDQSDTKEQGYIHACRRFRTIQPDIDIDSLKPIHDIWSFGLFIYPLTLPKPISCNLLDLFSDKFDNDENRPFWFTFKHPPKFQDSVIRQSMPKNPDPHGGNSLVIGREIYSDLCYGALSSMSCFYLHKDYIIRNKSIWKLRFYDELFQINSNIFKLENNNADRVSTQVKHKIPLDIIDRAAIFYLRNDGFDLFINMKGNVHELQRKLKPKTDDIDSTPFIRQGIRDGKPMPTFSTIRIRIRVKEESSILETLERNQRIGQDISNDEKKSLAQSKYEESLIVVRQAFRLWFDFFNNNRIQVSFGSIITKRISLDNIMSLNSHRFPTFIQSYSWAMLCNIGFRVQVQLYLCKNFVNELHAYSDSRNNETDPSEVDDRFYRLCLYLHRRSLEYFFLDFDKEIQIGISIYDEKYYSSKDRNLPKSNFTQLATATAYVPSVVLTPTTIKIRPLKLCKLNRVLREKRFGNCLNFALVELRDEAQRLLFPTEFRALKDQILNYLKNGFFITPARTYKYLHHSQSQVKCKQFWFYYHDKENGYLSHDDAYAWMGNFDKERVVAKHAARIALCFTSSDKTIQITADRVTYVRDVKDPTGEYAFTDGVGTISTQLRDEILQFLQREKEFSVLQIRYGGCKGTLSVDPRLDGKQHQLQIRDSMNKFTTDHDILELCKLSAPRALHLNRQDIVLLESRDIPHTTFLHLQNEEHLLLIRSLLMPSSAYELLQEKLLPIFELRKIARNINIVEEQFFIRLIITCAFNIIRELIDRTRIRISDRKARNMFGIVDEYGVLEYGQVFVQYTAMRENTLNYFEKDESNQCVILQQKVVITKNPCHHPGDLRVFDAVYHHELEHLKDVVVFPQKGHRPHPNEISGSDLDGDEYVVIWDKDLIPETPNEEAYAYDSQEDPPKMKRPITRDDINQIVMEVSEQDCLGSLSNIHLAYVDKEGIKSKICTDLAGAISQEVDAAKTGKHPLTEAQIADLRKGLNNIWPDFMKSRGKKNFYPSERILGKLYRSAHRSVSGWKRAISSHGNLRHMDVAATLTAGTDVKDQENNETSITSNMTRSDNTQSLDPFIFHEKYRKYLPEIRRLYSTYVYELLEIISLYRFQDEIDLFCRCESMDASAGGNKKGGLEDSASIEVQNLVEKIKKDFYKEFNQRRAKYDCCQIEYDSYRQRHKVVSCDYCTEDKLAKAACAYIYSYNKSGRLPPKSNRRILSFPWIFGHHLITLRERNRPTDYIDQSNTIVGHACSLYLENFTPKFKGFRPENDTGFETVELYYKTVEEKPTTLLRTRGKSDDKTIRVPLLKACFIEILNDWLIKQKIFGEQCIETDKKPLIPELIWHELIIYFLTNEYQQNVRVLTAARTQTYITEPYRQIINDYRVTWTKKEKEKLQKMFLKIHSLAVNRIQATQLTMWSYLDEYITLALQCIAIEKKLIDKWIFP